MAFRVYKPKNLFRVKAEQVTKENVHEIASNLMGRVVFEDNTDNSVPGGIAVPTFDGVKTFTIGTWILRSDDNTLSGMTDVEFQKSYEVARNVGG